MIVTSRQYVQIRTALVDKLFTDDRGYEYAASLYIKLTEVEQADMDFWYSCIEKAEEYLEAIGLEEKDL